MYKIEDMIVQFSISLKPIGARKKSKAWYLHSENLTTVINLQKSQWSNLYYVNFGVFLSDEISRAALPSEPKADLRLRVLELVSEDLRQRYECAFDLDFSLVDEDRINVVGEFLTLHVIPLLIATKSHSGLREIYDKMAKRMFTTKLGKTVLELQ